jgi:hypothetical protein
MIETVYEELKRLGAVSSCDQFSSEWLGMEKSYMRVLRAKGREPSAKAVARCASRLKQDSRRLISMDKNGYRTAARRLDQLAEHCIAEMLQAHGR